MAEQDKSIKQTEPTELADDAQPQTGEQLAKPTEERAGTLGSVGVEEFDLESLRAATAKAKRRRIITTVVAIALVATGAAAYFFFTSQGNQTAVIDPFEIPTSVRKGTFVDTVSGSGNANPSASVVVSPEVSGIIENLDVTVGQQVTEGDVLFTLKNDALDDEVRKAQEAVNTAQRALYDASDKVGTAERARDAAIRQRDVANRARDNAWDKYSNEFEAYKTAVENNEEDATAPEVPDDNTLVSTIDTATEAIDVATDGVTSALLVRDGAEAELASKQADLENAQKKADKRTVTAPMTGSVIAVNAENGQSVGGAEGGTSTASGGSSSQPLIQIANSELMKILVQVNEVDIESVAVGQAATVTFQAMPDVTLDSTVKSIADVATSGGNESSSGIVTYAVELEVENADSKIKPGMTASVTIITQQIDDVLIVPLSSVFGVDEGVPHVLRITDAEEKQYESVPVKIAARSMAEAVVEGDVSDGDLLLPMDPSATSEAADSGDAAGIDDLM